MAEPMMIADTANVPALRSQRVRTPTSSTSKCKARLTPRTLPWTYQGCQVCFTPRKRRRGASGVSGRYPPDVRGGGRGDPALREAKRLGLGHGEPGPSDRRERFAAHVAPAAQRWPHRGVQHALHPAQPGRVRPDVLDEAQLAARAY